MPHHTVDHDGPTVDDARSNISRARDMNRHELARQRCLASGRDKLTTVSTMHAHVGEQTKNSFCIRNLESRIPSATGHRIPRGFTIPLYCTTQPFHATPHRKRGAERAAWVVQEREAAVDREEQHHRTEHDRRPRRTRLGRTHRRGRRCDRGHGTSRF